MQYNKSINIEIYSSTSFVLTFDSLVITGNSLKEIVLKLIEKTKKYGIKDQRHINKNDRIKIIYHPGIYTIKDFIK